MFTRIVTPPSVNTQNVFYIGNVPPVAQRIYQCGPASLESVFRYWGVPAEAAAIAREIHKRGTLGVLNFTLIQYARDKGFWTQLVEMDEAGLKELIRRKTPPIVMLYTGFLWVDLYHYAVITGFNDDEKFFYANVGAPEPRAVSYAEFAKRWKRADRWCLILSPPERVDRELSAEEALDLGLFLEKRGGLAPAEKQYEASLKKNPESGEALFNLANIYMKTDRRGEAKAIYQKLFEKNPGQTDISNNLAWAFYEDGDYAAAIRVIETAFQKGAEKRYDILDTLGLSYCKKGDKERAREYLGEAAAKAAGGDSQSQAVIRRHLSAC